MQYSKLIILFLLVISCKDFDKKVKKEAIARVNNKYLYKEDIKDITPKGASSDDSTNIVNNYIKRWATEQLFIDQAKRNLTENELQEFDELVDDYKNTLYINAYKDAVITQSINMEITNDDLLAFYEQNIENFNLNEEIVKLRYLHLPSDYSDIVATQRKLNRFNDEDKEDLGGRKLEFISHSFNDSVWVSFDRVLNKLPILRKKDQKTLLKDGKYTQLRDSTGVYMVKIAKVLKQNQTAPLEYIKPTIRQIILNQRKRELIKNLEKDITKDAVKNKQFEVYN
ncbi:peptidyl-prolyl cis-trans isomerase [Aquimarina sp. 2201CG5-10]|uniref:peptidyl-prolyl cis-trans isomerase n=1 Tax=Aquimarina callyspongiae TaxID=3098150 RepID=UPI002AB59364|nr:peptidyl-prolyl cis-trans isomerase [Aquimarina sp. 2201CG5-10]MDY8137767.1 peptidyl-prolyl cis-trans isomerase [Aquimarina sp. 2201CG5-10]